MSTPQFTTGDGLPRDPTPYPVQFDIAYPDHQLSRLTTFFRLFCAIPILAVLAALSRGASFNTGGGGGGVAFAGGAATLIFAPFLMIVFRRKYPRWWFDFNVEVLRFTNRVYLYVALLNDKYPSTDEQQTLTLDLVYPDVENDLNRFLPIVKWLLLLPHYIVLAFLGIAAFFVTIFAWFAILFTGRYPRGAFTFVVGVLRWGVRVTAYGFVLTTDKYPPFSLEP
jgi:hypothetical protein